jgi:hypothetical protein
MSSLGFLSDGTGLDETTNTFAVFIPGTEALDVRTIDTGRIYAGNSRDAIKASDARPFDVNNDGRVDLAVMFESLDPSQLAAVEVTAAIPDNDGLLDATAVSDGPIGLHFRTNTGVDYLVPNIYALGEPIAMPTIAPLDPITPTPTFGGGTAAEAPVATTTKRATALTSIHPNPFNPETTVAFSLASDVLVRIAIYDVKGSLVRRLVDETMPSGEHQARWNGRDDAGQPASTGIYFVRMIAGSHTEVRKIAMLK